jgi:DNA-binding PadR family transcriptional regulator
MTNAELAILSLIVQEPRYGYQIEQVIEERGMRDWASISFSAIYYLLGKLEKLGWVTSETNLEDSAGPVRKVYRVTKEGMKAWRQATREVLSSPQRYCTPLQVGLANLPALTKDEAIDALSLYKKRLAERKAYVRKNLSAVRSKGFIPWHVEIMFDLSLTMTDAEQAWVSRLIKRLSSKRDKGNSSA